MSRGHGRAIAPRFYFNGESGKCEFFIYGGDGGNDNQFGSLEDCETRCNIKASLGEGPKLIFKNRTRGPIGGIFLNQNCRGKFDSVEK